jgi:uncharacterized membrane protein
MLRESGDGLTFGDFEIAKEFSEWIELAAVCLIAVTVVVAAVVGVRAAMSSDTTAGLVAFKLALARGLIAGLDLLIAADVIRTVTLDQTLENVLVLGLLVLVRIVLTWSLIVETKGHWPWQLGQSDRVTE